MRESGRLCLPRCSSLAGCSGLVGQTGQLRVLAAVGGGVSGVREAVLASLQFACWMLWSCRTDWAAVLTCRSGVGVSGVREAVLASLQFACLLLWSCRTDRAAALACCSGVGVSGVREAALASLQFACWLLGSCRSDRAAALACRSWGGAAGVRRELLLRGTAARGLRPVPPVPPLRTAGARPNRLGWCGVFCAAHHWTLQRAGFTSGSRTPSASLDTKNISRSKAAAKK